MFWIASGLYVAATIVLLTFPAAWGDGHILFAHDRLAHMGSILIGAIVLSRLRSRRFSAKALLWLDVLGRILTEQGITRPRSHSAAKGPVQ